MRFLLSNASAGPLTAGIQPLLGEVKGPRAGQGQGREQRNSGPSIADLLQETKRVPRWAYNLLQPRSGV